MKDEAVIGLDTTGESLHKPGISEADSQGADAQRHWLRH